MKRVWLAYRATPFIWKMVAGLIIGVLAGLIFGPSVVVIKPFGDLLLRLLNFLILPLILFTLIAGVNQSNPKNLGRMGGKVIIYYILTSAFALVVGLAIAELFHPGTGLEVPKGAKIDIPESPSFINMILNIVPENIVKAFADMNLLSIIFTALIFGIAITALRQSEKHKELGETVFRLAEAGSELSMKIMEWILEYVPIGVLAIVAVTVGKQGIDTLVSLGSLVAVIYAGLVVQLLVYAVFLLVSKLSPLKIFNQIKNPMITAFATQSSLGTLPVTLSTAKKMGLKEELFGFSLPLGATINMDGAAIRIGASAVFAADVLGVNLSLSAMIGIVLTGTLASIGTAGVPGAGIITITTVLVQAGLPIEIVALIASVDAILGMGCTALNITGDLVGTTIINKTERKWDKSGSAHEPGQNDSV